VNVTTLNTSPYTYDWNTDGVDPGQHTIKAVATDNGSLTANAQITVTVTVDAPTVSTAEITEIADETATAGGNVTDDGGAEVTARGVVWSETSGPTLTSNTGFTTDGSGTGVFTSSLTGLTQNKTYYVKAYAANIQSIAYGTEKSFTTTGSIPIVEIGFVTDVTHESAKCSGEVTGDNGNAVIAKGVVWADTWDVTLENAIGFTDEGPGIGAFVSTITGLVPSTNYYVRAYATNSKGTAYGSPEIPFSTGIFTGPPIVKTLDVTNIGAHVALSGFEFVDDGGNYDIKLGIVWGTSPNPDIDNNDGKEMPVWGIPTDPIYPIPVTSLSPETTYYVRAYGQTPDDVGYGEEISFTTKAFNQIVQTGTFMDTRDNTEYKTTTINGQTWMAENLAYLPEVCASDASCGYWVYDYAGTDVGAAKAEANYSEYGVLYNWEMAKTSCPSGWHLPSDYEWSYLEVHLGMSITATIGEGFRGTNQGGKMKEISNAHWVDPNTGATNISGFTALPGGLRDNSAKSFELMGTGANFWSSSQEGNYVNYRYLNNAYEKVGSEWISPGYIAIGGSVRCVQD